MVKRKTQPLIDSESSSDSDSGSDLDSELLSLAKKKKTTRLASNSPGNAGDSGSDSDSGSGSGSDSEDGEPAAAAPAAPAPQQQQQQRKKRGKAAASSSESEESEEEEEDEDEEEEVAASGLKRKQQDPEEDGGRSEPEEGQVSSGEESGSGSDEDDESGSESSSDDSEFDDGYDENLMGDEEDRARLNGLSEKERETEIFKRIERRDVMKTRWEIERKLKLAKKAERAKDKESQPPRKKKKKTKKAKVPPQQQVKAQKEHKEQPEKKKAKVPSPEPEEASPPPQQRQEESGEASEGEVDNESVISSSPEKSGKDGESGGTSDYFDPKERSKERKKNVEANRTDDKRSNAMAMLKAKREGKAKREEEEAKREAQRKAEAEDRDELEDVPGGSKSSQKLKASDIYSDDSGSDSDDGEKKAGPTRSRSGSGSGSGSGSDSRSSSDSETEGSDAKEKKSSSERSSSSKKPVAISTRDELNKLRLSRHKIERFIALPMFDTIVLNCFVRINIGNNNGRPVYRVAEIVGVVETAKIYQFGKGRTNKGFKLKHGSQERVFRLEFISNQDFSDSEYQKWISVCESTGTAMPCVDMIDKKAREIKEAIQYEFKDADIDKLIEEKNRFRAHPTNYAMKKTLLMKERDAAQLRGEDELARNLNTQIQELEERASHLDKRRSSSISLISYINDRNRKHNIEDAEKAIMEEIRATRGVKIEDPFTRRQTQPRMSFKANEKRDEPEAMQMPAPPPPGQKKKPDEKGRGGAGSSSADNNLYSLHDFEIDLDVPLPISAVNVLPKPVEKPVKESGPKRSLNLEDYKKKRGLI